MPIVAWLLAQNIPSRYNKLADILDVTASYDGATPDSGTLDLVTSLRWRAAREGDPLAQVQMAVIFDKLKKPDIAASPRACAVQHNPNLAK